MSDRSLVLVAIDGARDSRWTADFAVRIAKQRAADLRVLQVVPRMAGRLIEPPDDFGVRAALRALGRAAEREGVRVRQITLAGAPERVVPAYAELARATVVVVGRNYGTSSFWRNTSVVRRLIRSSSVPVIVVPRRRSAAEAGALTLKQILAPVDSTIASAVALRAAGELARTHDARVTLLHSLGLPRHMVFSGGEAWRMVQDLSSEASMVAQRLKRHAAMFGLRNANPVVVTGDPGTSITRSAAENAADLIVMGVAPRTWLEEAVFGSTLRAVLRRTQTPVMVLPVIAGAHEWIEGPDAAAPHVDLTLTQQAA